VRCSKYYNRAHKHPSLPPSLPTLYGKYTSYTLCRGEEGEGKEERKKGRKSKYHMAIYYQGIMVGPDLTCGLDSGTGWIVWICAWLLGVYVVPACLPTGFLGLGFVCKSRKSSNGQGSRGKPYVADFVLYTGRGFGGFGNVLRKRAGGVLGAFLLFFSFLFNTGIYFY